MYSFLTLHILVEIRFLKGLTEMVHSLLTAAVYNLPSYLQQRIIIQTCDREALHSRKLQDASSTNFKTPVGLLTSFHIFRYPSDIGSLQNLFFSVDFSTMYQSLLSSA
jgi:hypothetical protein